MAREGKHRGKGRGGRGVDHERSGRKHIDDSRWEPDGLRPLVPRTTPSPRPSSAPHPKRTTDCSCARRPPQAASRAARARVVFSIRRAKTSPPLLQGWERGSHRAAADRGMNVRRAAREGKPVSETPRVSPSCARGPADPISRACSPKAWREGQAWLGWAFTLVKSHRAHPT